MKKLLLAILCLAWAGCDNPEPAGPGNPDKTAGTLVSAKLDVPEESPAVNEAVRLEPELVFSGEVDSSRLKISWSVDRDGISVPLETTAERILEWIPTRPGRYSAHATVEYGDKTIEIYVLIIVVPGGDAQGLEAIRKGVIGKWKGTVTTPWIPAYEVEMEFRGDGTYSARVVAQPEGSTTSALYYGTDAESPLKTWLLDDVKANGDAVGEIQVYFDPTTTVDELRHLRLGEGGGTLSFEIWHFAIYGPVRFDLVRAP